MAPLGLLPGRPSAGTALKPVDSSDAPAIAFVPLAAKAEMIMQRYRFVTIGQARWTDGSFSLLLLGARARLPAGVSGSAARRRRRSSGRATPRPISSRSGRPSRGCSPPFTSRAATRSRRARRCSPRTIPPIGPRATRRAPARQAEEQLANLQAAGKPTEIQQAEANLADAQAARDKLAGRPRAQRSAA